jgi:hypothetical protein
MEDAHCKPTPWVSLRRDQLIPVNKAVNEKEHLEKGLEVEEKKKILDRCCYQGARNFFRFPLVALTHTGIMFRHPVDVS